MSLAALREELSGKESASELAATSTPSEASPEGNDGALEAEEAAYGVAQVVTPAGLEIYYQAGPKRLYRVRAEALRPEEEGGYPTDWREVISVSTVLDVLEKGGLSWWGMKVGVLGALHVLNEDDFARLSDDMTVDSDLIAEIVSRLTEEKRTVNHVKSAAGDRGTNVHTALEAYADTGVIPDPQFYPAHERGYVEGVVAFLRAADPEIVMSEVMVASATDGWAGRFDAVAILDNVEVVVKTYPKKKPKTERLSGRWLLDLKTSKGVYESYRIQTAAYRRGLVECGYGDVDHLGIVRVTSDGKYEVVESHATYEDFQGVLAAKRAVDRNS